MKSKIPSILVVDDDEDTCANLQDILTDLGCQVDVTFDGFSALKLVEEKPYDLALLDLKMPGMDGLELYRRIKKLRAGTLAIIVTAYAASESARAAEEADATGIWHRALYQMPDQEAGYRLTDNAAALLLTADLRALGKDATLPWSEFSNPYFGFVLRAFNPVRHRFRNRLSASEKWLEEVGSEESQARALWALGAVTELNAFSYLHVPIRTLFEIAYPAADMFVRPRSWADALLGLNSYLAAKPRGAKARTLLAKLKDRLSLAFTRNGNAAWPWPEDTLSTGNARLPHGLLVAAHACDDELSVGRALNSLEWLMERQTSPSGVFRPASNTRKEFSERESNEWHRNSRPLAQRPEDVYGSVSACLSAWRITGQDSWYRLADNAFQWFFGANDLGLALYDPNNGASCDALREHTVDENQSAPSLLAYHLSLVELQTARMEFFASQGSSKPSVRANATEEASGRTRIQAASAW